MHRRSILAIGIALAILLVPRVGTASSIDSPGLLTVQQADLQDRGWFLTVESTDIYSQFIKCVGPSCRNREVTNTHAVGSSGACYEAGRATIDERQNSFPAIQQPAAACTVSSRATNWLHVVLAKHQAWGANWWAVPLAMFALVPAAYTVAQVFGRARSMSGEVGA